MSKPLGEEGDGVQGEEGGEGGKVKGGTSGSSSACFNCGGTDHSQRDCPKPRDAAGAEERRRTWQKERGNRPSWTNEPRYWDESKDAARDELASVKPGRLSDALCRALGISANLAVPPPFYSAMAREGYPPGYVGLEGEGDSHVEDGADKNKEWKLKVFSGDEIEEDEGEGDKRGLEQGGGLCTTKRRTVATVFYAGLFGQDIPPGADRARWAHAVGGQQQQQQQQHDASQRWGGGAGGHEHMPRSGNGHPHHHPHPQHHHQHHHGGYDLRVPGPGPVGYGGNLGPPHGGLSGPAGSGYPPPHWPTGGVMQGPPPGYQSQHRQPPPGEFPPQPGYPPPIQPFPPPVFQGPPPTGHYPAPPPGYRW